MLGTIMEVIIIPSYPPQLQEEQEDPYVLDQDNNRIQQQSSNICQLHCKYIEDENN